MADRHTGPRNLLRFRPQLHSSICRLSVSKVACSVWDDVCRWYLLCLFLYWCPALPCFGRKEHHRRGPVHPRSLHISRRKPASNAVCPITLYMFVFGSKIILSLWLSSYCYCNSILTLISSVEVYQPFLRRSIASSVGKREKKRETLSVWRVLWAFVLLFFHPPSFVAIRNNVMRFVLVFPHQFPRSHTQSIVASYSVASDPYLQHKH